MRSMIGHNPTVFDFFNCRMVLLPSIAQPSAACLRKAPMLDTLKATPRSSDLHHFCTFITPQMEKRRYGSGAFVLFCFVSNLSLASWSGSGSGAGSGSGSGPDSVPSGWRGVKQWATAGVLPVVGSLRGKLVGRAPLRWPRMAVGWVGWVGWVGKFIVCSRDR